MNGDRPFYDDDDVFAIYMARRERPDNANDTLEKPVLLELMGDPAGKRLLDLGCGAAAIGRWALQAGCQRYAGIEISANMVAAARQTLAGTDGQVEHASVEEWTYPPAAFDLVISRLALHYVDALATVFARVYDTLAPGGRFIFSVEHPVLTASNRSRPQGRGQRQDWEEGPIWPGSYPTATPTATSHGRAGGRSVYCFRTSRPRLFRYIASPPRGGRVRHPLTVFELQNGRCRLTNLGRKRRRLPFCASFLPCARRRQTRVNAHRFSGG
jgi:SAM-dependent methyltransferase